MPSNVLDEVYGSPTKTNVLDEVYSSTPSNTQGTKHGYSGLDWSLAGSPGGEGPGIPSGTSLKTIGKAAAIALPTAISALPGVPLAASGALALGGEALSNPEGEDFGKPADVAKNAVIGAVAAPVAGAVMNAALKPVARPLAKAVAKFFGEEVPQVAPRVAAGVSPEAETLLKEGTPLTYGQQKPSGIIGSAERLTADQPVVGLAPEREAAKTAWQKAQLAKVLEPGSNVKLPDSMPSAMKAAHESLKAEYKVLDAIPIEPETVASMPEQALSYPGQIPDKIRQRAQAEISDALSVLPKGTPTEYNHLGDIVKPASPPELTAGDLIKVREEIRKAARNAGRGASPDFDRLAALDHAEDVVTSSLEQNLPEELQKALRETDRRYAMYNTIEKAMPPGQETFTPRQLLASEERNVGKRPFKQGAGSFRESAEAAQKVFQEAPKTGFIGSILGTIPGYKYAAGPMARLANASMTPLVLPNAASAVGASLLNEPTQELAGVASRLPGRILRRSVGGQ